MVWLILSAGILNLGLSILIWAKNSKRPLNYSFGLFGFAATVVCFFDFLFRYFPSLTILRSAYAFAALMPAFSVLWISELCHIKLKNYKKVILVVPGITFFVFSY